MALGRQQGLLSQMLAAALGAVVGVVARSLIVWAWPTKENQVMALLLIAAAASFATALALGSAGPSLARVFTLAVSGAAFSFSVVAVFIMDLPISMAAACILGIPLCACAGLAVGALVGLKPWRATEPPVDGR